MTIPSRATVIVGLVAVGVLIGCQPEAPADGEAPTGLLLTRGRIYTFAWPDPAPDGTPSPEAPVTAGHWSPDAEAVLIENGRIAWVGTDAEAEDLRSRAARVIDLAGATVLPGLVDSHTHIQGLGARLRRVDLVGVQSEDEAIARVREQRPGVPAGQWIVGWGWDDGAWAAEYPTWDALSDAYPENPVALFSLHGFALWANRAAFERAGIDRHSEAPVGGEILTDAQGEPTGILLNRATTMLGDALGPPTGEELRADLEAGLAEMAHSGYTSVHEAGTGSEQLAIFRLLEADQALPQRVYAMLSARDTALLEQWITNGIRCDPEARLRVCSVKAYYDGALGSRGARLLDDYSDRPGHRGVSGEGYGFDQEIVARAMATGFQVGIHAIGDAGNRETLDFLEAVIAEHPEAKSRRHRIEHAQVLHPDDFARFEALSLIASMQPPHLAEDKSWAQERLGPERSRGAYAWRSLRQAGAELIFSSDLAGSDHDFFYGLHSAVTRQSPDGTPDGGWFGEQAVTVEEAIRAYSTWAARAAFLEDHVGTLQVGRFADLTVIDLDPFEVAERDPGALLDGSVVMTVVGGDIVFEGRE